MKTFMPFMSILATVLFASTAPAAPPASAVPGAPAASAVPASKESIHRGTVTYAKTAGGYSYLQVKESGRETWLATMPLEAAIGEEVEYAGGDAMTDFHSKAMDKTFDSIRFVTRIRVVGKDMPKKVPKTMPKDDLHKGAGAAQAAAAPVNSGEIVKPRDGKTIEAIFAEKEKLKGSKVLLRAKVVKFSKSILGKNWATLADGTGKSPDDKIVAVTMETLALGDVVTAVGTLKTNVNLGAGYRYKAILEDAKFN